MYFIASLLSLLLLNLIINCLGTQLEHSTKVRSVPKKSWLFLLTFSLIQTCQKLLKFKVGYYTKITENKTKTLKTYLNKNFLLDNKYLLSDIVTFTKNFEKLKLV